MCTRVLVSVLTRADDPLHSFAPAALSSKSVLHFRDFFERFYAITKD